MANGSNATFVGKVSRFERDLATNTCSATLVADDGDREQVAITDPQLQTLLETAMILSISVSIVFDKGANNTLSSVDLNVGKS